MSHPIETIPFFSAQRVNSPYDLSAALQRTLESNWFVLGPEVKAFEDEFAAWCGVPFAVSVANGTDALELSLRALNLDPGSEVLLAANAGFYSSTALSQVGLTARYVDIDPQRMTICPIALEHALAKNKSNVKAIIATHLYGQLADVAKIRSLADQFGVWLIEDCAQSHGAQAQDKKAGSWGHLATFSFYPTKNLGALGDGGIITTQTQSMAEKIRQLRQYGWGKKYSVDIAGGRNSRLDELQAAVLRTKLRGLDFDNAARLLIAENYNSCFSDLPLRLPTLAQQENAVHLYVIRTNVRDDLIKHLMNCGVSTEIHYPIPDYRQRAVAENFAQLSLKNTENACAEVLSLPCYPRMPEEHQERVITSVRQFFLS